jgi:predicted RNA-binding protein with PIN domain
MVIASRAVKAQEIAAIHRKLRAMYVIDGHNLLHACWKEPGLLPSDYNHARERMIRLISELARRESTRARVYFDGTGSGVRAGELAAPGVRVTFSGAASESADRAVREHVENAEHPRKLRVVSGDHEVINACRLNGARIVHSREMAARLAALAPAETPRAAPEKPTTGAGRLEREMLEEIGDFEEFRRDVEKDLE